MAAVYRRRQPLTGSNSRYQSSTSNYITATIWPRPRGPVIVSVAMTIAIITRKIIDLIKFRDEWTEYIWKTIIIIIIIVCAIWRCKPFILFNLNSSIRRLWRSRRHITRTDDAERTGGHKSTFYERECVESWLLFLASASFLAPVSCGSAGTPPISIFQLMLSL